MPRNGSGVYSLPPGTTVAPGTTIQSSWANALTADLAQDANDPRPIGSGGSGASTAGGAADAFSPDFVNVASGTTTNIGAATSPNVNITGTTTITAFDSATAGIKRFVKFAGALTLTHNATSLILPGAANITTAAGDAALFISEGSGNWRCLDYQRASGLAVAASVGTVDVRRNRIVNHDMRISQENATAGTTNGYYAVDQWATYRVTSAGTITSVQASSTTPAGSPNRYRVTITTADASLAAGEYLTITQYLEGSNVADFRYGGSSAKNSVLRFGFKGPAGTYAAKLGNSAANRSYVALFTIASGQANTDTVQTISIPGDTTGTWLTADGVIGIELDIVLACGSTFQGTTGWQAGNIFGTSAVSNGMGTGAAVFELFDVGLKLDPDATGVYGQYEVGEIHPVYRSERYWAQSYDPGTAPGSATSVGSITGVVAGGSISGSIFYPVLMAKIPAVILYNPTTGASNSIRSAGGNFTASAVDPSRRLVSAISASGTTNGNAALYHYTANARL